MSAISKPPRITKRSLIYRSRLSYRLIMNFLYFGGYKTRFKQVIALLDPTQVNELVELCFGDIYIAQWCKEEKISYIGYDINPYFVTLANEAGYCAELSDLRTLPSLPNSDVYVMIGSLYHFHDILHELIEMIMVRSPRFIISEPIKNWASRNDILGRIARHSANAGYGNEHFRYTEQSLIHALKQISSGGGFSYTYRISGRDAIVDIHRN